MQRQGISDVRILLINGYQLGGLLTVSESGVDEDPIEVPENGKIRLIGSGMEKIKALEVEYLVKRTSAVLKYFLDWRTQGKFARDVVMLYTDKSGDITSAYRRDSYPDCEMLGFVNPAFDQAGRQYAKLKTTLAPWDWNPSQIG